MLRATLVATQKVGINRTQLAGRLAQPPNFSTRVVLPLKFFDGATFRGCVPVYRLCSGGGGDGSGDKNKKPPNSYSVPKIGTDFKSTSLQGPFKLSEISTMRAVKAGGDDSQGKGNEEIRPVGQLAEICDAGQKKKGKTELLDEECRDKGESAMSEKKTEKKSPTGRSDSVDEATERIAKEVGALMAKLPNKEQSEKYFFRVVAFIYDICFFFGAFAINFVEKNIIQNPTVKTYWKKFHEKMEQAKKD